MRVGNQGYVKCRKYHKCIKFQYIKLGNWNTQHILLVYHSWNALSQHYHSLVGEHKQNTDHDKSQQHGEDLWHAVLRVGELWE